MCGWLLEEAFFRASSNLHLDTILARGLHVGTNIVEAKNELSEALKQFDTKQEQKVFLFEKSVKPI